MLNSAHPREIEALLAVVPCTRSYIIFVVESNFLQRYYFLIEKTTRFVHRTIRAYLKERMVVNEFKRSFSLLTFSDTFDFLVFICSGHLQYHKKKHYI
jgi:hypothetical protein